MKYLKSLFYILLFNLNLFSAIPDGSTIYVYNSNQYIQSYIYYDIVSTQTLQSVTNSHCNGSVLVYVNPTTVYGCNGITPLNPGVLDIYTVVSSASQTCPVNTILDVLTNICIIPCEPPVNKIIVPVLQASCIGDQTINNVSYTSMEWGCDNQCYASSSTLVTCDELLNAFESSCNSVTNIPNFKCYENGLSPLTVDSSCTPKSNPCDTIITDFSNNCKAPNVINGDCTSANFAITSNTLECLPPPLNTNPCDTFRNNLVVTCKFPNYITGSCDSLDGLIINTNSLICNIPTLDGSSTATTTDDTKHQTDAITSSIEQTTLSSNKRLDSLINNSSNLYASSQTTNTKLDSLINNINSNSVNNINKLDELINEAKSINSKSDIRNQYIASISDKIQQGNTKLDGIKSSIDSINNNTDNMLNGDSDDKGVSNYFNGFKTDFINFRDNISQHHDNFMGQLDTLQSTLDGGFINNLPTALVTTCPYNNNVTFGTKTIPFNIDACSVVAPMYSVLYLVFYVMFFASFLSIAFNLLISSRS